MERTTPSPPAAASPPPRGRDMSWRKPVPAFIPSPPSLPPVLDACSEFDSYRRRLEPDPRYSVDIADRVEGPEVGVVQTWENVPHYQASPMYFGTTGTLLPPQLDVEALSSDPSSSGSDRYNHPTHSEPIQPLRRKPATILYRPPTPPKSSNKPLANIMIKPNDVPNLSNLRGEYLMKTPERIPMGGIPSSSYTPLSLTPRPSMQSFVSGDTTILSKNTEPWFLPHNIQHTWPVYRAEVDGVKLFEGVQGSPLRTHAVDTALYKGPRGEHVTNFNPMHVVCTDGLKRRKRRKCGAVCWDVLTNVVRKVVGWLT